MGERKKEGALKQDRQFTDLREAMAPIDASSPEGEKEYRTLVSLCQLNPWLCRRGIPFIDDPFLELDCPYTFSRISDISVLEAFFEHGNWCIRQGVVFDNLFFCNQVNGGDEWWTCRYDEETKIWIPFESISFRLMIQAGEFHDLIHRMRTATAQQCKSLEY